MSETDRLINDFDNDLVVTKSSSKEEKNFFSDAHNFAWIEASLLINVFLFGFDGTITSSTYSTIGNEYKSFDLVSWISSSYMIAASTTLPLASISDVLGRRSCISFALLVFGIGCFGCYLSGSMGVLILMRAVTGVGGGGLMSLSTITNSDIIYKSKRGLFQAIQNLMLGTGAVCGASFGGILSSYFGWRWCFGIQVAPTLFSLIVALLFIPNETETTVMSNTNKRGILERIDFMGSFSLILSLLSQLLILTTGGIELSWSDWKIKAMFGLMIISTVVFFKTESSTTANPIIPMNDYKDKFVVLHILLNYCIGLASYTYLFILPILFQINLGDSVAQAGFRLSIPAVATPIGGLLSGIYMAKYSVFSNLVLLGTSLMAIGNFLGLAISKDIPTWVTNLLLIPANLGQGLVYPSSLFLFVYYFDSFKQASSTSTVYLMRNIGGVWGIASITAITQAILKKILRGHLELLTNLSDIEIDSIILKILKSIDFLDSLDPDVKGVIVKDYTLALRVCQLLSGSCCVLAFVCCLVGKKLRS